MMITQFEPSTLDVDPIERDVHVTARQGGRKIRCTVHRLAIQELYDETYLTKEDQKVIFTRHENLFARILANKVASRQVERDGSVVILDSDLIDYKGKFGTYKRPVHAIWEEV